ncbi:MAG TPA: carboxypeptidase-like regulatory domain-containing protein [Pyrinomonadaceae bacterium]
MNPTLKLAKWLAPAAALFALACALLAPVEAGGARRRPAPGRAQDNHAQTAEGGRDETPADSVVRGRVVYDDTSRPVRRARVMLINEGGGRGEYSAQTDARGDFRIAGVRAGAYYAFVDVPGVLSPIGFFSIEELRAAQRAPDLGEGRKYFDRVEVDGKQDATVTVRARRGGSIAGRVSYADGDPAVNVHVSLMRRAPDGRLQKYLTGANAVSISGLRTDDRGMFRLTGLPPGEYVVAVSESVNHGAPDSASADMSDDIPSALRGMLSQQFLMTFYPSATKAKEATAVKVELGDERADVDITIPERALRTVSGVVRARRGGRPVPRARVFIVRRDDQAPAPLAALLNADEQGRWQLWEIPDGAYTIHVKPPEEYESAPAVASVPDYNSNMSASNMNTNGGYSPPRRKRGYAPTRRDLEVSGDVSEFVVEVADGARISGTISVEGGAPPPYAYVSVMRVADGVPVQDEVSLRSAYSAGAQFNVEGLAAGQYFLQATAGGSESGLYLKSISWSGKDLLREPLELAEGSAAEGIRIVYASNPAKLSVTARAAGGKRPAPDVLVYLVPADLSAWSPHARPLFCMTGATGACHVAAPPGEYRVVALRRSGLPNAYEQEVRRRAASAPRVTLREGETGRVELEAPEN